MAIPKYDECMLPLLKCVAGGGEYKIGEVRDILADTFSLTDEERQEVNKSGQRLFDNRVHWAKLYLVKAGLLDSPKRGVFSISPKGLELLQNPPEKTTAKYLRNNQQFSDWFDNSSGCTYTEPLGQDDETTSDDETPDEVIISAYTELRRALQGELLDIVKQASPQFFEHLVIDVLLAMGYGGSYDEAARHMGKSGDGGIDGVIKEDRLGLDEVVIQAKRWENTVSRPEVQAFVGSMSGYRARKGVFITTSKFTQQAVDYAGSIEQKVVLIDGDYLTSLMIDYGVGVSVKEKIEIKEIDSDYFPSE